MNESSKLLKLLSLKPEKPSYDFLEKIVGAFMSRVPFENVSKLYYLKTEGLKYIPSFEKYLEGIERCGFGGTCYSNNYYLSLMLKSLGFEAKLCGADMRNPDVHTAINIKINKQEYMVDAGYAAPFLKPLTRDSERDMYIVCGEDSYIIKPKDSENRTRVILFRNGIERHGYLMNSAPKKIKDFNKVIVNSFKPEAVFLNSILLTRFKEGSFIRIHNMQFSEINVKMIKRKNYSSKVELYEDIHRYFNIPLKILKAALDKLHSEQDAWS